MSVQEIQSMYDAFSACVLANLSRVDDVEYAEKVLACKDQVSVPHEYYWEMAVAFMESHGRYPDHAYLISHEFTDGEKYVDGFVDEKGHSIQWTKDIADQFLGMMREHRNWVLAGSLVSKFDREGLKAVVEELGTVKTGDLAPRLTATDMRARYDEKLSQPAGMGVGVDAIDDVVKGLSYGTLSVFAAAAGGGKTTMLLSALYKACFHGGFRFVLISLEMSQDDVMYSLLSIHARSLGIRLPAEALKKGLLEEEEVQVEELDFVIKDWAENKKGDIFILTPADFQNLQPETIDAVLRQVEAGLEERKGRKLDGVAVDYVQLLRYGMPKGASMSEYLNNLVSYFSVLARGWGEGAGLIVVLLSQINREGWKKLGRTRVADLTMLAELNSLERDASVVIAAYSDTTTRDSNQILLQVIKNRTGRTMEEMIACEADFAHYSVGEDVHLSALPADMGFSDSDDGVDMSDLASMDIFG